MSQMLALAGGIAALFAAGLKWGPPRLRDENPENLALIENEDALGYELVRIPECPGTPDELLERIGPGIAGK